MYSYPPYWNDSYYSSYETPPPPPPYDYREFPAPEYSNCRDGYYEEEYYNERQPYNANGHWRERTPQPDEYEFEDRYEAPEDAPSRGRKEHRSGSHKKKRHSKRQQPSTGSESRSALKSEQRSQSPVQGELATREGCLKVRVLRGNGMKNAELIGKTDPSIPLFHFL